MTPHHDPVTFSTQHLQLSLGGQEAGYRLWTFHATIGGVSKEVARALVAAENQTANGIPFLANTEYWIIPTRTETGAVTAFKVSLSQLRSNWDHLTTDIGSNPSFSATDAIAETFTNVGAGYAAPANSVTFAAPSGPTSDPQGICLVRSTGASWKLTRIRWFGLQGIQGQNYGGFFSTWNTAHSRTFSGSFTPSHTTNSMYTQTV